MQERELVIAALWQRLAAVVGVVRTARNPINPPRADDLPCINFFELDDRVTDKSFRGSRAVPSYKRELMVVVEAFVQATSEPAATKELGAFVVSMKKALYEGGVSLGIHGTEMEEVEASRVLRPPNVERVAGIGLVLRIRYIEDVARLFR